MMQKPNPMDYPMTIDGALQYQTDLQNWQAGLRNRLKANMAPDTIQVSPAEYEALRRDAERYRYALDHLRSWELSVKNHYGACNEKLTEEIDAAINMPANGEGGAK
jgi:hypothetical protein